MRTTSILIAILLSVPSGVRAADLSGSARLWGGPVEVDSEESDQLDQKYRLEITQTISEWLRLSLSYRRTDFRSQLEAAETIERSSDEPRFELTYERPELSARFSILERDIRSSNEAQNLDIRSALGRLEWRPLNSLRTIFEVQEDSNVADSAIFGRDTDSTRYDFTTVFDREHWGGRYSILSSSVENKLTSLRFDQDRHEAQLDYGQRLWGDRLLLSADILGSRVEQVQSLPTGGDLVRPVPIRQGLFAIDTSPEVGELDSAPGLVDGDLTSAVLPRIEIGGANTFRNIGVDLGITRAVTRIEVTVDAPSAVDLVWEAFHGPDNLNWIAVPVTRLEYDEALLRYTLVIPATTNRFFKAVNVSVNSRTQTAVTEIRALEDVESIGRTEGKSTSYRGTFNASYDASEKVNAILNVSLRNEEDLAGGLFSRDLEERSYRAGLRFEASEELTLRFGYDYTDVAENLEPAVESQQENISAQLEWEPLPSVDVTLVASSRKERDDKELIRSSDTLRLSALTELLPDLRLTSSVTFSRTDDPFSGFEQSNWQWTEALESRPTDRWVLGGSFSYISYDSTGDFLLTRRTNADLRTSWAATPFLTFQGQWGFADDDRQETLSQRYGISWSPGRRLSASLSYQDIETETIRRTSGESAGISYQPNRWAKLWLSLSRSEFEQVGVARSEIRTARIGMNLFF
ncbi:MAG: hypothetical protein GY769_25545 [bacterium]|nr:hypothetical protein [bacterium]